MDLTDIKSAFLDLTQDPVGVGYIGPDEATARLVHVNDAFVQEFGYAREHILGQPVDMLHDKGNWRSFLDDVGPQFRAEKTEFVAEGRLVRGDGSQFWASIAFLVLPDGGSGGRFVCATYRDITRLKDAEEAAHEALRNKKLAFDRLMGIVKVNEADKMRLFAALNSYPEPVAIFNSRRQLFLWNKAFALTVSHDLSAVGQGMTAEEIIKIARKNGKFVPSAGVEPIWLFPLEETDSEAAVQDVEVSPGQHWRVLRSRTARGDYVVMCLDISAAVQERQAAQSARERLVAALNAYPDPIVIYDKDLYLVSWNAAYAETIVDDPDSLSEGMHLRRVLELALETGRYTEAEGREQEWIETILSEAMLAQTSEDIEMEGDVHYRLSRSRAANGDYVVVRMNATQFVRQKRAAEAAQARLIAAFNAYPSPVAIYDKDRRLVAWNNAYRESMTSDPDALRAGMTSVQVARMAIREGKIVAADGDKEDWMSEEHQIAKLEVAVEDIVLEGDIHHRLLRSRAENGDLMLLRIDTTELVRQRRTLEATQERLISAINAYPDPFAIYDADYNLVVWNPAYARSMSNTPSEIAAGTNLRDLLLIAANDGKIAAARGREEDWVEEYFTPDVLAPGVEDFEAEEDTHFRMVRSRADNGETVVLRINITEVVRQRRAMERYAAQLEAANEAITYKALHDELTDLGNRRYLSEKFDEFIARRTEEGGEIAALHVDLDRFKQINDTMGHLAGDAILKEAAQRICERVEEGDVVARIGGDEFVILLYLPSDSDRPETLARNLIEYLSRPVLYEGKECRFGASIGLARTPLAQTDELLTNSDVALYKAKNAGRARLGVFDQSDLDDLRRNKAMADDIQRAIDAGEFVPFYQPQVDAITGRMVGMEALARWQHPEKGVLSPGVFLDTATDLNVAADIDRLIFEKAIVECQAAFGDRPDPPDLAFNVSANRLDETEFETIKRYVSSYSGQVAFELLETIFMEEESTGFLFQLDRLREIGIAIEVDDFGSGRASVVALQRIAPDRLKVDRRLVAPVTQTRSGLQMIRSIVEIGMALGIGVTAEGVETLEQAEVLADLGCDRLQGFYFAKPMAFADLLGFVEENQRGLKRA